MDLATFLQGGGTSPGSGVPIAQGQPPTLGSFQDAIRNWMMQRPQMAPGVQPWLAQRPDPHQYMTGNMGGFNNIGDLMAQHPGRNWHPSMMMAQRYQNGM